MTIRRFLHKLGKGHVFVYAFDGSGFCHYFDDGDRLYISSREVQQWYGIYVDALMSAKKAGWLDE